MDPSMRYDVEKKHPGCTDDDEGISLICFPYSESVKFDQFPVISKNKQQEDRVEDEEEEEEDEDEWMKGALKFRAKENYIDDRWVIDQAQSHMESLNNTIYPKHLTARAERLINCCPSPSPSPSNKKRRRTASPQPRIWYAKRLKHMPPHFTAQQASKEQGAIIMDTQRRAADMDYNEELQLMDLIDAELSRLRGLEAEMDSVRHRLGRYHKLALREILIDSTNAVSRYFGEDLRSEPVWSKVYYDNRNEILRRDEEGGLGLAEFDSWIKPANPLYNDLNDTAHNFTDDTYEEAIKAVGGNPEDRAKWREIYDFVRRERGALTPGSRGRTTTPCAPSWTPSKHTPPLSTRTRGPTPSHVIGHKRSVSPTGDVNDRKSLRPRTRTASESNVSSPSTAGVTPSGSSSGGVLTPNPPRVTPLHRPVTPRSEPPRLFCQSNQWNDKKRSPPHGTPSPHTRQPSPINTPSPFSRQVAGTHSNARSPFSPQLGPKNLPFPSSRPTDPSPRCPQRGSINDQNSPLFPINESNNPPSLTKSSNQTKPIVNNLQNPSRSRTSVYRPPHLTLPQLVIPMRDPNSLSNKLPSPSHTPNQGLTLDDTNQNKDTPSPAPVTTPRTAARLTPLNHHNPARSYSSLFKRPDQNQTSRMDSKPLVPKLSQHSARSTARYDSNSPFNKRLSNSSGDPDRKRRAPN